jgi:hypothetical protein
MEQSMLEQQRRIEAEKQARQRMRDQILLQTFTTERDLIITRDDRLNSIDSIINLTATNNKRVVKQIEETKAQITRIENSGREVPENIRKKLENLRGQHEKNKDFVTRKQAERDEVANRFAADLQRFRELKGIAVEVTPDEESAAPVSEDVVQLPEPEDAQSD